MQNQLDPRSAESQTPVLYPPRKIPSSVKRKGRDNRILLTAQVIEDHVIFSGFKQDDDSPNEPRFRFRDIIGKQTIYQELDLHATLAPHHQSKLINQSTNSNPHIEISSNNDLQLTGTAMITFPAELRRFFYKIALDDSFDHMDALTRFLTLYRHYTNLAPFTQMDKALPTRYNTQFGYKRSQLVQYAVDQLYRATTLQFPSRYACRYVNPPQSITAKAQKKKQREIAKLQKLLSKKTNNNDNDDDDDDEIIPTKSKKNNNENEEGTDDERGGSDTDSSGESSDGSEFDDIEINDDDDDDYQGGASGDDEPTF